MERVARVILAVLLLALALGLAPGSAPAPAPSPAGRASAAAATPPGPLDAVLSLSAAASPSQANPRDLVAFDLTFLNSGNASAARVWINDTLPAGLSHVSDTASAAGSTTPFPSFTFAAVPPGSHSFRIIARVDVGVAPGTVLTDQATLAYVNAAGVVVQAAPAQASVLVGIVTEPLHLVSSLGLNPQLTPLPPTSGLLPANAIPVARGNSATFDLSPVLAKSFRATGLVAYLYLDSSTGGAASLSVNVTVADWNGATLVQVASQQQANATDSSPGFQRFMYVLSPLGWTPASGYTFPAGHTVRLRVTNLGASTEDALLATNATTADSRLLAATSSYASVDQVQSRDGNGPATVWSPKDSLVVWANVSDPFGGYDLAGATLNLTSPSGTPVVAAAPMGVLRQGSGWIQYTYRLPPPLANGTWGVEVVASDRSGATDAAVPATSPLVRAPAFTLVKLASVVQAKQGQRFTYTIYFNNTGTGPAARVWLNDTMPSQVTFVSSPNATSVPNTPLWALAAVGVGAHWVTFDVKMQGSTTAAYIRNGVSLNYTDEKGYLWPLVLARCDTAVNGPAISLSLTSNPLASVNSRQSVVLTLVLTNNGDAAQTVWLNVSLSAGLGYVSYAANPAWGTGTPTGNGVAFRFTNMPGAGTAWTVTVNAQAGSGLVRGSALAAAATLNSTSVNGVLMPPTVASRGLTVVSPWIVSASLGFAAAAVSPGQVVLLRLDASNAGNDVSGRVWVNLTLDANLSFVTSSMAGSVTGNVLRLTAASTPLGGWTAYVNVSVGLGVQDAQPLSVNGSLAYADRTGNPMPSLALGAVTTQASLPSLTLSVSPLQTTLEAGTLASFAVALQNRGSGAAGAVWLNLTLPGTLVYLSDTADGARSVVGSSFTWTWSNLAPGTKSFVLRVTVTGNAPNNGTADLTFHADYTDGSGHARTAVAASARVTFVGPVILLELTQSADSVFAGDRFRYVLTIRNVGATAAAYVNVTDALDPRLTVVSIDATVPPTGMRALSWNFTNVPPGAVRAVTLEVQAGADLPGGYEFRNSLEAFYGNSAGTPVGYVRSGTVFLDVVADLRPLVYILVGGGAVGGFLVFLVWRRNQVQIEEIFLVTREGLLISHLSRTMVQDKDRDQLSGMLTAVQEFVKDAFTYGAHRELHQMEFGDYHILLEQGKHAYLAVVYRGRALGMIRRKVRNALDHVESSYGKILEGWDGNMDSVLGARDVLRETLLPKHIVHGRTKAA